MNASSKYSQGSSSNRNAQLTRAPARPSRLRESITVDEVTHELQRFGAGVGLARFRHISESQSTTGSTTNSSTVVGSSTESTRASSMTDALASLPLAHKTASPTALDGTRLKAPTYLVPKDEPSAAIRLSPSWNHGGYSKIRYGVDAHGKQSIWRMQRFVSETNDGMEKKGGTRTTEEKSFSSALAAMKAIASPLLPSKMFVDQKRRVFSELPIYEADLTEISEEVIQGLDLDADNAAEKIGDIGHLIAKIARDVLETLVPLHEQGYVHRDLKPDNIFYKDGKFVLADFDLVVHTDEIRELFRSSGTPGFMAPETLKLVLGQSTQPASDLFALGLSLLDVATAHFSHMSKIGSISKSGLLEGLNERDAFLEQGIPDFTANESDERIPIANVYHSVASFSEPMADIIFESLLARHPMQRVTAQDLFAEVSQLLPKGSSGDQRATELLEQTLRVMEKKDHAAEFAKLAALPPLPV